MSEVGPDDGWVLGLDEAGRGSLVGPLVVGGFLVPQSRVRDLPDLGACDSKLLNRARRAEVYERLGAAGRPVSIALPPSRIDRYVAKGRLNRLEAEAMARLIHATSPSRAYVDACDPVAARFGALVSELSGRPTVVIARHRADRDLPLVGAASIVAKVRRDRAMERLRRRLGAGIGSGYPSDARTVDFVRQTLATGGPAPRWLRSSWETTARLMRERSARTLESYV